MAKKEFTYKGRTLDQLKTLSIEELADIFPSRQRRSIKRGLSDNKKKFLKKIQAKDRVKTHEREVVVLPFMVGKTILIYNGKTYVPIMIQEEMIGHFLGEFSLTRNKVGHSSPGVGATRSSANVSVK